jgi:hypothetical protein
LYKRVLAVREVTLGHDHPDVASALNNLWSVYVAERRFDIAQDVYRTALQIRESALGAMHLPVKKVRDDIRGWKLHRCTGQSIGELARKINPKLRGWFNYYGRFMPSAFRPIERHVGQSLVRWACRKYKKLRNHRRRAWNWPMEVLDRQPNLLALWEHQRSRFFTIGAV